MKHTTLNSAQNFTNSERSKIYEHQLLQHVTVQNKEVRYIIFCCVLPELERAIFTAKIVCYDEGIFLCPGTLTDIIFEVRAATIRTSQTVPEVGHKGQGSG